MSHPPVKLDYVRKIDVHENPKIWPIVALMIGIPLIIMGTIALGLLAFGQKW